MKRKNMVVIICSALFLIATACGNDQSKSGLMPELATCDSAAVMYYKTPGNPRFFTYHKVYDRAAIELFDKKVNAKTIHGKDSCITDGKIYFYSKGGAVYPVYFSRAENCLTLSFIKTGEKYYTPMNSDVKKLLDEWQGMAKELSSPAQ